MRDLHEATSETVHLAVLDGAEVVYVAIRPGRHGPRLPSRVGGRMPAHATGVGKAILAFSPPEVAAALIDAGLERRTPRTIADPGALRRELTRIRGSGSRSTGRSPGRASSAQPARCSARAARWWRRCR